MGIWFDITAVRATIVLDEGRRAEAVFTVGNATDAPIRGEAVIQPGDGADPSWFVVDRPERSWEVGESDQVVVAIVVPADVPAGARSFRLRIQLVGGVPEEDFDAGPPLGFDVPPTAPPPIPRKPFPWWIVALVLLVIVIVVAGGVFVATRPSPTPTPAPSPTAAPTPTPTPAPTPTPTPGLPNLVIDPGIDVVTSSEDLVFGERPILITEVTATIRNIGQSPAGPFSVRAESGVRSATQAVGGLAPDTSTTVTLTILGLPRRGTITVDPTGSVSETNEGDNQRAF
ncbi:MAG: CARDB domain-containing protein [Candidatus Limnocylindrales bacterium]